MATPPIVHLDPLLTPIKGRSRALVREGWPRGRTGRRIRLSHVNACNPLLQAHPTWAQGNTKAASFPLCLLSSPLRAPPRVDPFGLGHAATIYLSVQGPPGVETPTSRTPQVLAPQVRGASTCEVPRVSLSVPYFGTGDRLLGTCSQMLRVKNKAT
jgi:hypothetical protein